MNPARRLHYSYEDYLSALDHSDVRLEYLAGEIFAMAGGTAALAHLATKVASLLTPRLPGCTVFSSDLKVRIEATDLTTYPDLSVVCGPHEFSPIDRHALTNPALLVEITSRSTEDYDRGAKLAHYQRLVSLQAVLFVSHRNPRITLVRRTADGWTATEHGPRDVVTLEQPALSLAVDDVFRDVILDRE